MDDVELLRRRLERERRARKEAEALLDRKSRELYETNQELERARDAAQASERMKAEFLASMSHEIRTPMNAIIGLTGLLLDSELGAEQRDFAETVRSSAESLLGLINDILDFSKIEAGRLTIEPIPFDLEVAAGDVVELLASKAQAKGIELVLRYAPGTPLRVVGDPGRIRQVLVNLVSNAVKFTEGGHVVVDVEVERAEEAVHVFRLSVTDTGIGIGREALERLFQKFVQADASTTRRYGGTGLGLAICKQLVELMGGTIGVESEPGRGSTFWITLPLPVADPEPAAVGAAADLHGLRILVVDDNAVNRRIVEEQTSRWGITSVSAASGKEALRLLRQAYVDGEPFDMAVVDHAMPEMDGEGVARAVKDDRALERTVLVLLTSVGQRGDAKRLGEAGFAAYLTRPIRAAVLRDALAAAWAARDAGVSELITRHTVTEQGLRAPGAASGPSGTLHARVLLAEDNPVNQKVAVQILLRFGCRVDTAANGREAVEMLERLPYDLVLMDCQMPELDGYEATREIRRRQVGGEHVPIVAMTAHAMEGDRQKCLDAGMDDYVSKPVRPEALREVIERWRRPRPEEAPAVATPASPPPPEERVLDEAMVENLFSIGEEAGDAWFEELISGFLTGTARRIDEIRAASACGDWAKLKALTHDLKGSSGTFGAAAVSEVCRALEGAAQAGAAAEASALAASLEQAFERFKSVLADRRAASS